MNSVKYLSIYNQVDENSNITYTVSIVQLAPALFSMKTIISGMSVLEDEINVYREKDLQNFLVGSTLYGSVKLYNIIRKAIYDAQDRLEREFNFFNEELKEVFEWLQVNNVDTTHLDKPSNTTMTDLLNKAKKMIIELALVKPEMDE